MTHTGRCNWNLFKNKKTDELDYTLLDQHIIKILSDDSFFVELCFTNNYLQDLNFLSFVLNCTLYDSFKLLVVAHI